MTTRTPFRPPAKTAEATPAERRDALNSIRTRANVMCAHDAAQFAKWAAVSGSPALIRLAAQFEAARAGLAEVSNREWREIPDVLT